MRPFLLLLALLGCSSPRPAPSPDAARSPSDKVFAPYAYLSEANEGSMTTCLRDTGQLAFVLAFVVADADGGAVLDGRPQLGVHPSEIVALQAHRAELIVSLGGATGPEPATRARDVDSLERTYRAVVDEARTTWLDFDIEGVALDDRPASVRRGRALAALQASRPGLRVTLTVPAGPAGLAANALALVRDTRDQGVVLESVNLMTMGFPRDQSAGRSMGRMAVDAATAAHERLAAIDPALRVGITPLLGPGPPRTMDFTLADARTLVEFARGTPWVRSLSFWSLASDRPDWRYTRIFQGVSE